ncbi:retrovirus-related pol polyprotein from transposon TNT 1-94 [Tanacetum coccineum]|uniref:Retrovirus-related pol polyprotein from transposon TNT 1-94 n=1 Tax=Tanacetum coccineum TaxID=301880 RepID=A0ABQ5AUS0_9ASTR
MSENEDRYHDNILDLEAKLKKNVDLMLKLGNSLQGIFMLGPKPLSVYDPQLKHGLGETEGITLVVDDASKSQQKMKEKMNDPIAVANKQNCWTIDYQQINDIYKDFVPQKELSVKQKYFPSSFIPSDKTSNATYSIPMEKLENEKVSLDFKRWRNLRMRRLVSRELTQSKSLDTTSVVSKPKIAVGSASKAKHKVVQIIMWIVDSGCSKHMTGDRSLLRNFIEKFMGTVRFGNDNFAAITGYGDYIQGNITICHVYYVEEGDDFFTGGRESNLYTISISDMAASSPVCLMSKATSTKSWLWHRRLSHLNFGTINDLTRLDLVYGLPKFIYGKDHLCSACERGKSKKASHPPKLVPINQEDSADFNGNLDFVPYNTSSHEEIESSTAALEPSNVQNFHQVQPSTHIWTKDHPLDQVIGDLSKPVMTRQRLQTDFEVCMYALTVSTIEPKNIKEAMADHSWIESMQDELNQFKRLQVWELVPRPEGKNIIALK